VLNEIIRHEIKMLENVAIFDILFNNIFHICRILQFAGRSVFNTNIGMMF